MKTTVFHTLLSGLGFDKVLEIDFSSRKHDDQPNKFFIFWQEKDSLLLCHDTFSSGWTLNGGRCYFNLIPNNGQHPPDCSGGFTNEIWAGDFDCRYMERLPVLRETGSFVSPWKVQPFLWLCHHDDKTESPSEKYKSINRERILLLPKSVQQAITPPISN